MYAKLRHFLCLNCNASDNDPLQYIVNSQPQSTGVSNRIESLDSIRGIAALAVLMGHTVGSFAWPLAWSKIPFINIFFEGYPAVIMFFVLSGFVLSRP